MATGTLSSPIILAGGTQATFAVTGGTWGGTLALASATAIAFVVTSPTPSGGTLARTVYAVGVPTHSGGVITVTLSDYIFVGDENGGAGTSGVDVTVTASAGAIADGTDTTAALGSTAVTNNSTLAYPIPACQWGIFPYQRQTGSFDVLVSVGGCIGGRPTVSIKVTDSAAGDETKAATEEWVADADSLGNAKGDQFYKATFTAVGKAAGAATINAVVTAVIGTSSTKSDSSTDATWNFGADLPVYLDPSNAQPHVYAAVDPAFADDTAGVVYSTQAAAEAAAATTAYKTQMGALRGFKTYNNTNHGHDDADGGVMLLVASLVHVYGTWSFPSVSTVNHPVTITRVSTATRAQVNINAHGDTDGLRTKLVKVVGVTVDTPATSSVFVDGASIAGSVLVLDSVVFVGNGRTDTGSYTFGAFSQIWAKNSSIAAHRYGFNGCKLARGCSISDIGENAYGDAKLVSDCACTGLDATGTVFHPDLFIIQSSAENFIVSGLYAPDNVDPQGIFLHAKTVSRVSVRNLVHEGGAETFKFSSTSGANTLDNWWIENVTGLTGFLASEETAGTYTRFWFKDSYFEDWSDSGAIPITGHSQVHTKDTAARGYGGTTGSADADLFTDAAGNDWTPKAGSALLNRGGTGNVLRDLAGVELANDGTDAIGAFQATVVEAASTTPRGQYDAFNIPRITLPYFNRSPRRIIFKK